MSLSSVIKVFVPEGEIGAVNEVASLSAKFEDLIKKIKTQPNLAVGISKDTLERLETAAAFEALTGNNYYLVERLWSVFFKNETEDESFQNLAKFFSRLQVIAIKWIELQALDTMEEFSGPLKRFKRELFRLEPTATILGMVRSQILPVKSDCKQVLENLLLNAIRQGLRITVDPARAFIEPSVSNSSEPDSDPHTTSVLAYEALKDIQRLQALISEPEHLGILFKVLPSTDRSARQIALKGYNTFKRRLVRSGISDTEAKLIYDNALSIQIRSEQTWAAILASETEPLQPAVRKCKLPEYKEHLANFAAETAQKTNKSSISYTSQFRELEAVDCDDCESVLSPGAYFVDLMQAIQSVDIEAKLEVVTKKDGLRTTLLDILLQRRPDLETVLVNCENTKFALPYIDLVNEILESFISTVFMLKTSWREFTSYNSTGVNCSNMGESDSLSKQNTNLGVYQEKILQEVYPMVLFPYDYGIDCVRNYLGVFDSSLYSLIHELSAEQNLMERYKKIQPTAYNSALTLEKLEVCCRSMTRRACAAEYLGLTEEDYFAITKEKFMPIEFVRLQSSLVSTMPVKSYQEFMKYKGAAAYWGYSGTTPTEDMLDIEQGKGLSFIRTQFLERSGISFDDLMDLLKTNYIGGRLIITSADGCNLLSGSLDEMRLRSSILATNDENGKLDEKLCEDLQAFIRLQRILHWDISTLDSALRCVGTLQGNVVSGIHANYIDDLATIKELSDISGVNIPDVVSLWIDLDTNGPGSLYSRTFLARQPKGTSISHFAHKYIKVVGKCFVPADTTVNFSDVIPELVSALKISWPDILVLQQFAGVSCDSKVTLSSISALYRILVLCKILKIDIKDYGTFRTIFDTTQLGIFDSPTATLRIVKEFYRLIENGWDLKELQIFSKLAMEKNESSFDQNLSLKATLSVVEAMDRVQESWPEASKNICYSSDDTLRVSLALFEASTAESVAQFIEGKNDLSIDHECLWLHATTRFSPSSIDTSSRYIGNLRIDKVISNCTVKNSDIPKSLSEKFFIGNGMISIKGYLSEDEISTLKALEKDHPFSNESWMPTFKGLLHDIDAIHNTIAIKLPDFSTVQKTPITIPTAYSGTLPGMSMEQALEERRFQYLKLATARLRQDKLEEEIFKLIHTDFPTIEPSILKYLSTAGSAQASDTIRSPVLSSFSLLIHSLWSPSTHSKCEVNGLLIPASTDQYTFEIMSENRPNITINEKKMNFSQREEKPASRPGGHEGNEFSRWVSDEQPLVAGQVYSIKCCSKFDELFWSSKSFPAKEIDRKQYIDTSFIRSVQGLYNILNNLQIITQKVPLSLEEFQFLTQSPNEFTKLNQGSLLDLMNLSIESLYQLTDFEEVRRGFKRNTGSPLVELLKWLRQAFEQQNIASVPSDISQASITETLLAKIAEVSGWAKELVTDLIQAKYPIDSDPLVSDSRLVNRFNDIRELVTLKRNMSYITKLGFPNVKPSELVRWAQMADSFKVASKMENILKNELTLASAKSKVSEARDLLTVKRRTALVTYLLNTDWARNENIFNEDSLFEFFLIDVKMGPQMKISRIRQAVSTIQLFVQRCFLGLETKHNVSADALTYLKERWADLGRYNLWEANRKVYLYPENWVDPTLRDNKSEQFKDFESRILRADLNEGSVAEMLKGYIFDTNQIAYLDIQAYLWENNEVNVSRFHFFGRTRTTPRYFYYRSMEVTPLGSCVWNPWNKLNIDIHIQTVDSDDLVPPNAGTYLVPAIVSGRLYLFIPELMFKKKPALPLDSNISLYDHITTKMSTSEVQPSNGNWTIKIGWSERHKDGQWTPKVTSADILTLLPNTISKSPKLRDFKFKVRTRNLLPQPSGIPSVQVFPGGRSTEVLVIDVECHLKTENSVDKTQLLGQFELRDSQLYLIQEPNPSSPKDTPTFRTAFSKVQWKLQSSEEPITSLPTSPPFANVTEIEDANGRVKLSPTTKDNEKDKLKVITTPLLIDFISDEERKLSWTISFDATKDPRPLGVVVDVETSGAGPQTYFAQPKNNELPLSKLSSKSWSETVNCFSLDHRITNRLMESATKGTGLKDIYLTLSNVDELVYRSVFGLYGEKHYNERYSPYSLYNWELGVHAVSLLMERLFATQQFELAIKVAHLVFDPTKEGGNLAKCWLFPPFADSGTSSLRLQSTQELLQTQEPEFDSNNNRMLTMMDFAVEEWRKNPFNAHSVARGRPVTYMKRIVMKYVEILIAAGDQLFRQNSMDTSSLATQLYLQASHVMGPELCPIKRIGKRISKTYKEISGQLDTFSNTRIQLELEFPFSCLQASKDLVEPASEKSKGLLGFVATQYFCVPTNPRLKELRSIIDDRLEKLRSSKDIDGNSLSMPLFDPPIDLGLSHSMGITQQLGSAQLLNDFDSPLPNYRFLYLLGKAFEITAELKAMGESLLIIREKRDLEALSLLKCRQETSLQNITTEIKAAQMKEAEKSIESLIEIRNQHEVRLRFYLDLIGEDDIETPAYDQKWRDLQQDIDKPNKNHELRMNKNERLEMDNSDHAAYLTSSAAFTQVAASLLLALPNFQLNAQPAGCGTTTKWDEGNIANSLMAISSYRSTMSQYYSMQGQMAGRKAQLIRQLQDNRLQANMAARDIKSIDQQIKAQKERIKICEAEIKMQKMSVDQSLQTMEWYQTKYTNEELYAWMENRSSFILHQTYTLAIDTARKAEKAFRFEKGFNANASFLQKSYWDTSRGGLFAAQELYLGLKKMEMAYVETFANAFEITKNISLRQLNPAALFSLQTTGEAVFSIPEVIFDFDFPGHYLRRIKSVSVSIPCIVSPYTGINATLTLLESKYRVSPLVSNGEYIERHQDSRFRTDRVPISSIIISHGQADTGRFETSFTSERYGPFENAGVISQWKLELPKDFQQFDYDSISDIILHFKYTAEQGSVNLKQAAINAAKLYVTKAAEIAASDGLWAYIDIRNEYSSDFMALTRNNGSSTILLKGIQDKLPFWTKGWAITVTHLEVFIHSPKESKEAHSSQLYLKTSRSPDDTGRKLDINSYISNGWSRSSGGNPRESMELFLSDAWNLRIEPRSLDEYLEPIDGLFLLLGYHTSGQRPSKRL
ncbi:hypothetical protein TWF694_006067 [Orbilia ellipsospora]|uniref:Uncharacterized protein n=1 Tax=Orbilia ellipsospora TaxID=2528407 RepID=A0AAV9WS70_9PEZI